MLRDPALVPLSHQHQHALALCVMTRRGLAADASPANRERLARRIRDRFELEISNHFEVEEQVLFPEAEHRLGPQSIVAELIAEHRRMEVMVREFDADPSAERLESFCALLEPHVRREEQQLFQHIQRQLPRAALDELGRAIARRVVRICL